MRVNKRILDVLVAWSLHDMINVPCSGVQQVLCTRIRPSDVVRLTKEVWFRKLSSEQVDDVEQFLEGLDAINHKFPDAFKIYKRR